MTFGEFKDQLASFPDDWEITFAGGMIVCRLKQRDVKMVNVEFDA